MRIIARSTLTHFAASLEGQHDHAAVRDALAMWFHLTSKAHWKNASEIRRTFASASIVNAERIVFNIKGNDYRLIAAIDFQKSIIWIKWLGTHRDYDRIDAAKVEHG